MINRISTGSGEDKEANVMDLTINTPNGMARAIVIGGPPLTVVELVELTMAVCELGALSREINVVERYEQRKGNLFT